MLIAPILKVDYLSKQTEPHNSKIKDVPTNIQQQQNKNNPTTSSTYNIFKTALNRGTELIKNTFLSKSTSFCNDSIDSNTNPVAAKLDYSSYDDSSSESSESSSCESEHSSSPDSIKTELMLFKPIVREPRTTSSAKILKVPTVRSTSSNSTIQTPCPSPFFIPISSQRQSAFSLVVHTTDTNHEHEKNKPKNVKRKHSNRENKKSDGLSPKHKQKIARKSVDREEIEIKDTHNTRLKTEKSKNEETKSIIKTRQQSNSQVTTMKQKGLKANSKAGLVKNNNEMEFRRVTRSMKKN